MELEIHTSEGPVLRQSLVQGPVTVGGGAEDHVRVEGLLPSRATFERDGEHVFVTCAEPLSIEGVWVPPNVRRLLLPREAVELTPDVKLGLADTEPPAGPPPGTAAVLRSLLGSSAPVPVSTLPSLTCLTGPDAGRVFALADLTYVLGRGPEATLRLRDRAVSRRHARLWREADGFWLEDLGTPNGAYVDNAPVLGPTRLVPGAILELGRMLLRFQSPAAAAAPASAPAAPTPAPEPEGQSKPDEVPSEARLKRRLGLEWWLVIAAGMVALLGTVVSLGLATSPFAP